jgi:hypothetical protein
VFGRVDVGFCLIFNTERRWITLTVHSLPRRYAVRGLFIPGRYSIELHKIWYYCSHIRSGRTKYNLFLTWDSFSERESIVRTNVISCEFLNHWLTALHLIVTSSSKDHPDVLISRYFSSGIYFCYPATWLPCEIMREQDQCHWFYGFSILLSDDFENNASFVYEAGTAGRKLECGRFVVCSWPVYGLWWEKAGTRRVLITWYMMLNWKAERFGVSLWFMMAVSRGATECACACALRCCS